MAFSAYIDGVADNSGVSWQITNAGAIGSINSAGVYSLPGTVPSGFPTDTIQATYTAIPSLTATATAIISPPPQQPAVPVAFSPQTGSGTGTGFGVTVSDSAGFSQIATVNLRFGTVIQSNENAQCFAQMFPQSTTTAQVDLNGGGYPTSHIPWSSQWPATISTAYCSMAVQTTSMTGVTGTNMTANFPLTFFSGLAGARNAYVSTQGVGYSSAWPEVQMGSYTVVAGPSVVSVSPASGSGGAATFVAQYSDPAGAANLQRTELLVSGASGAVAGACYVQYRQAENSFYLRDDTSSQWLGGFRPGSAVTANNSQCSITGTGASVTANGSTLTVSLPVTFKSGFASSGTGKTVFGLALDNNNVSSGYQAVGSWTISTPSLTFVKHQYQDFMSRSATAAELGSGAQALDNGTVTQSGFISATVYGSTEFFNAGRLVEASYLTLLNRHADYGGWNYYTTVLEGGSYAAGVMPGLLIASSEYQSIHGTQTNDQFLTMLYQTALHRAPDSGGYNYWIGVLNGGGARGDVAANFMSSGEYTAVNGASLFGNLIYDAMVRRNPTTAESNSAGAAWTAGTQTGTIQGILGSSEYLGRVWP